LLHLLFSAGDENVLSAEYEIELKLSPEQAWEKLRDLSCADQYVQGLTGVDMTTEATEGVGASRRVYQGKWLALDETVIEWREGEGFSIRLHRGEKGPVPPMTEAYFDYALVQREGKLYIHNRMRYRLGLGWFGALLNRLAIASVVAGAVRDTTIGQMLFYERGEKVTPAVLKEYRKSIRSGE
jgi:hypothetical protein